MATGPPLSNPLYNYCISPFEGTFINQTPPVNSVEFLCLCSHILCLFFIYPGGRESSDSPDHASLDIHEEQSTQDSSSGYHSNPDEVNDTQQQQLSSLELENRLLKNEVASLNQEMASVIQRAKSAQDGKIAS